MAGDKDEQQRLIRRAQIIAAGVILALVVLLVVVDTLGRLFIDPTFRVSEIILGTLVGALLTLLGLAGAAVVLRRNGTNGGASSG